MKRFSTEHDVDISIDSLHLLEEISDHARKDTTAEWAARIDGITGLPPSIRSLLPLIRALKQVGNESEDQAFPERIGDFEILGMLGRGGMGVVYRARQRSLDRIVAMKVLPAERADHSKRIEEFQQEAKLIASLQHDHIVEVHEAGVADGYPYFTMRYIDGQSLNQVVRPRDDEAAIPVATIIDWMTQANLAMAHLHSVGIIHRDIKPSNLMVDHIGKIWILDFGIARILEQKDLTDTNGLSGTLRYISPERFDSRDADQRSDVYALGAVAFELLTGEPLVTGDDPVDVIQQIRCPKHSVRERLLAHVPPALAEIIVAALAIDPAERIPTATAFVGRLRQYSETAASATKSGVEPLSETVARPIKRANRLRLAGAFGLLFAGMVALWPNGFANFTNFSEPNRFGNEMESRKNSAHSVQQLVVNTIEDTAINGDGRLSLREALLAANASDSPDRIVFDLPGSPPHRFSFTSPLPVLADDGIVLDGQPPNDLAQPRRIELSGARCSAVAPVLAIRGRDVQVTGLAIVDGPGVGIWVCSGSDQVQIKDNHIGVRVSSGQTTLAGNATQGIFIEANASRVTDNLISGNGANGIWIRGNRETADGRLHQLANNRIGTDALGCCGMGNRIHGIVLSHAATDNQIVGNLVSGNGCIGIFVDQAGTDRNTIVSNRIGTDLAGVEAIGNATWGVVIGNASGNVIGERLPNEQVSNRIAGNAFGGIAVIGGSGRDNLIAGNLVQSVGQSSQPQRTPPISLYVGAGDDFVIPGSINTGSPQTTTVINNRVWEFSKN